MIEPIYHTPALLNETIDGLNIKPESVYVDVTFGGGGHSKEILKKLDKPTDNCNFVKNKFYFFIKYQQLQKELYSK